MGIFLMGGGQPMVEVLKHRGSVIRKENCYRGTYNGKEYADMPPRTTYKDAYDDAKAFCEAARNERGGMCSYSLAVNQPRKVLAGTDTDEV